MAGSTPIYGFPYPQSTDLVADYPTLGQELAEDVETVISGLASGLNLVTPTSIANSGGSASRSGGAVTFTSVNYVSCNGIFTAGYDNYKVMLEVSDPSADSYISLRLRASGTDATTNYFTAIVGLEAGLGSFNSSGGNPLGSFVCFQTDAGTTGYSYNAAIDLHAPFLARKTGFGETANGVSAAGMPLGNAGGGFHSSASSYDGLSVIAGTGTFSGVIRCYGYKNS